MQSITKQNETKQNKTTNQPTKKVNHLQLKHTYKFFIFNIQYIQHTSIYRTLYVKANSIKFLKTD